RAEHVDERRIRRRRECGADQPETGDGGHSHRGGQPVNAYFHLSILWCCLSEQPTPEEPATAGSWAAFWPPRGGLGNDPGPGGGLIRGPRLPKLAAARDRRGNAWLAV